MIYIIRRPGSDKYKIGYTKRHPQTRIDELQTGGDEIFKTVMIFEGERSDEDRLHQVLDNFRLRPDGEWFQLDFEKLLATLVNVALNDDRVDLFSRDRVTQATHLRIFLAEHFICSDRAPESVEQGLAADELYKHYLYFCKRSLVRPIGEKYFLNSIKATNIGHTKFFGDLFFTMRVADGSILNHD